VSLKQLSERSTNKEEFNKVIGSFKLPEDQLEQSKEAFGGKAPVGESAIDVGAYLNDADLLEKHVQRIINNAVKPLYTIAASTVSDTVCLKEIAEKQNEAISWGADVSLGVATVYSSAEKSDNASVDKAQATATAAKQALDTAKKQAQKVIDAARAMVKKVDLCSEKEKKSKKPTMYDPVDVISETVNFYVTASGSVTPGWKLVSFTAPISPTLFSASRKDTDTLIFAMGRPAPATSGSGIASTPTIDNQIFAAILSQAISSQRSAQ
jgi:hypothetical protein